METACDERWYDEDVLRNKKKSNSFFKPEIPKIPYMKCFKCYPMLIEQYLFES